MGAYARLGPMYTRITAGTVVAQSVEPGGLKSEMLGIDAEAVVAEVTRDPGSLDLLDLL